MRLAVAAPRNARLSRAALPRRPNRRARPEQQLAHDIYKELIEINTVDSVGNTTTAANAVAKRLSRRRLSRVRHLPGRPAARQGQSRRSLSRQRRERASRSCCSRISTSSRRSRPIGRRTSIRSSSPSATATTTAAARATTRRWRRSSSPICIRFKQEGYVPDRDIILALTADEEGGPANGVRWLIANHKRLDRRRVRAERRRRRLAARRQAVHQLRRRGGKGLGELHRVDGESRRTLVGSARRQRDLRALAGARAHRDVSVPGDAQRR